VADLAAVTSRTRHEPTVEDDATTDTDLPGEVDDVAGSRCHSPHVLRNGTEIGVVADDRGRGFTEFVSQCFDDEFTERRIDPTEVRRETNKAIGQVDDARDPHSGSNPS
jgi:hypothetical protein